MTCWRISGCNWSNDGVKIDEPGYAQDLQFIKAMIRFEIDNALFGVADGWRHLILADPQAQMALSQFAGGSEASRAEQGELEVSLKSPGCQAVAEGEGCRSLDHNHLWGQIALAPTARPC